MRDVRFRAFTAIASAVAVLVSFMTAPAAAADEVPEGSGSSTSDTSIAITVNGDSDSGVESSLTEAEAQALAVVEWVPFQIWAACGSGDPETKLVRSFSRAAQSIWYRNGKTLSQINIPAGASPLQCGTSGSGYHHINTKHSAAWGVEAAYSGQNWRMMADWGNRASAPKPCVFYV